MVDIIGAKLYDPANLPLKRDFLFFDKIATAPLDTTLVRTSPSVRADIEWLRAHELVTEVGFTTVSRVASVVSEEDRSAFYLAHVSKALLVLFPFLSELSPRGVDTEQTRKRLASLAYGTYRDYSTRFIAAEVSQDSDAVVLPIVGSSVTYSRLDATTVAEVSGALAAYQPGLTRKLRTLPAGEGRDEAELANQVLIAALKGFKRDPNLEVASSSGETSPAVRIVLNSLPVPDDVTPWDKLLEFRSDERTRYHLLMLRKWVRKVTSETTDPRAIGQELDELLASYGEHMRVHRIKSRLGRMEQIVAGSLGFLENLVKLNWSSAAKNLFALARIDVALLEAEREAPGRELAYIVKAHEYFR